MRILLDIWLQMELFSDRSLQSHRLGGGEMSGYLPPQARQNTLQKLVSNYFAGGLKMHLGVPGFFCDESATLTSCAAHEASFPGYSPQVLSVWDPVTVASGVSGMSKTSATFTSSGTPGTGDITGYYLTDIANTLLFGGEVFSLPQPINVPFPEPLTVEIEYDLFSAF